jgi:hypothetical protein
MRAALPQEYISIACKQANSKRHAKLFCLSDCYLNIEINKWTCPIAIGASPAFLINKDKLILKEVSMKTKQIFFLALLLVGFFFFSGNVYSQETKDQKKALDAFVTATTKSVEKSEPVPGAEITVEQVKPTQVKSAAGGESAAPAEKTQFDVILKSKLTTNDKGEFTLVVTPDQFKKLPEEFQLKFTIKPKDPSRFPVENNSVVIKVKKSDGPKFTFVVTYQKPTTKSNKGYFAISSKAQSGW